MITCEERKNRLLKANNLMKRLNLNSILVVGNGSVATNEYGFYRYFVDNRVYYHRQALVIVADETPTVCCGSLTHLKALNERGFWDVRMVGDRLAEGLVDILGSRGITNGRIGYCPETLPASWFDCIPSLPKMPVKKQGISPGCANLVRIRERSLIPTARALRVAAMRSLILI